MLDGRPLTVAKLLCQAMIFNDNVYTKVIDSARKDRRSPKQEQSVALQTGLSPTNF